MPSSSINKTQWRSKTAVTSLLRLVRVEQPRMSSTLVSSIVGKHENENKTHIIENELRSFFITADKKM